MKQTVNFKALIGLVILFFMSSLLVSDAFASSRTEQKVYDEANLLTETQIQKLEVAAEEHGQNRETDFIILTTLDADGKDIEKYLQDAYDEQGFGYDKEYGNTAILAIDMGSREFYLAGFYKAEAYLDGSRLDQIRDKIIPDLSDGNYYEAFLDFIETGDKYMGYRPGVNPESIFFKTYFHLLVALVLAGFIVFIMAYNSKTKVTTTPRTYRDDATSKVLNRHDLYVRTQTTKTRKPPKTSGGGGSSGGGGGMTGGGHSHSGSRGSF